MKILSYCVICFVFVTNISFAQNRITNAVHSFVNDAGMKHASISIQIVDLKGYNVLSEYNPNLTLPTASTAKLFSTATAIELLGPNYHPKTRLYIDGNIDSAGILNGNIWIRGGGDPSLASKYFTNEGEELDFMQEWIVQLKDMGIKKVNGGVIADASEFHFEGVPDDWNWVDMGNYYGAGPSGLTIYDNLLRYTFTTASVPGEPSILKSIEPEVPNLNFHNYIKSSNRKGDNSYLYGAPFSLDRFGTGTLPVGQNSFVVKGSLPDPENQFAYEFNKALIESGISVFAPAKSARSEQISSSDKSYQNRTLVHTQEGIKVNEIIKETNHKSINLFAEHLINLIGYTSTGNGSTVQGLKILKKYWEGKLNTEGLVINDGSGLSRSNAISASHFTQLLYYMQNAKDFSCFYNSLPTAGVSGTLKNLCKNQAGQNRIKAKSGTMTRIKSYAGYAKTTSNKNLAFAIVVNNSTYSRRELKSKIEQLLNAIATY